MFVYADSSSKTRTTCGPEAANAVDDDCRLGERETGERRRRYHVSRDLRRSPLSSASSTEAIAPEENAKTSCLERIFMFGLSRSLQDSCQCIGGSEQIGTPLYGQCKTTPGSCRNKKINVLFVIM